MRLASLFSVIFIAGLSACTLQDKFENPFIENFDHSRSGYFKYHTTGIPADFKYAFGVSSPSSPGTKIMSFKLDPDDSAGAGRGPEIVSRHFTYFGTYAARLKIPDVKSIQPDAGAVVGYFTYYMDREKGLSEIDIEWLIADPEIIYVGTWTGPRDSLRRIGRSINLAKGIIYDNSTRVGHSGKRSPLTGEQDQPKTIQAINDYNASTGFYTYGFDWYPDRLRWWMIRPVTRDTVVLWNYHGSKLGIPQNKSLYRMNFWRTKDWAPETNPAATERPLHPYELEVDWMSYSPFNLQNQ